MMHGIQVQVPPLHPQFCIGEQTKESLSVGLQLGRPPTHFPLTNWKAFNTGWSSFTILRQWEATNLIWNGAKE
ncbi:hypothetical protein GUJ93_ZPchr0004g39867 [Zizania palustris]|uniref:Uncharacterized protein n=1 Tax=Zizania palustris TaxID=103762 RepID=A0A8J5S085_ZIZPA|nr:hypothetical protein GUJ93_ZPchr0004g39867 [Zizania palustris]